MIKRMPGIYEVRLRDQEKEVSEIRIFLIPGGRGKRSLMVDAGFGSWESLAVMEVAMEELGIRYENLDVFLTHKHHDHCGLASTYAKKGARLFMNPEEERHSYDCLYFRMGDEAAAEQREVLRSVGIAEDRTPKLWNQFMALNDRIGKKREPWVYTIHDYPYIPVREGQVFEYGEYRFQAVLLRGHTYGQMGLYDREKKVLFSADQVIDGIAPIVGTTHKDEHLLELYFQSLAQFKSDYRECTIFPAHNGQLEEPEKVVDRIVFSYLKKMEQVKQQTEAGTRVKVADENTGGENAACENGVSETVAEDNAEGKTVWEVTKKVYHIREIPEDDEDFVVMKSMISKTFSCLEYLYDRELVQRREEDGVLYWSGI